MDDETPVSRTDDDALGARASAVTVGYWQDAYIKYFVKRVDRKPPIINLGTHVRTFAIDRVIRAFLDDGDGDDDDGDEGARKQIISLGAGSDTRAFTLAASDMAQYGRLRFRYHEIDFPHVCQRKARTITSRPALYDLLKSASAPSSSIEVDARRGAIVSDAYCLHPLDLASIGADDDDAAAAATLSLLTRDSRVTRTLIVSEVCLIYLAPDAADRITHWCASQFTRVAMVIYEPMRGDDAFGRMMVRNLAARGLVLRTLDKYDTLAAQQQRLLDAGFAVAKTCTMEDVYGGWMTDAERARISCLERLDEVEEWSMLAQHYCVALAWSRHMGTNHGLAREFGHA